MMWLCRRCLLASRGSARMSTASIVRSASTAPAEKGKESSRRIASQEASDLLKDIPGPRPALPRAPKPKASSKIPFPSPRALVGQRGNTGTFESTLRRAPSVTRSTAPPSSRKPDWLVQKEALANKFTREVETERGIEKRQEPWQPRKKLSPEAMQGIRALRQENPDYDVPKLANIFKVSPEAIRRILRSKWQPTPEEAAKQAERWRKRKQSVWSRWAEQGRTARQTGERQGPALRNPTKATVTKRVSVQSDFV